MFNEEFLDRLPEDPYEALKAMSDVFETWFEENECLLDEDEEDAAEAYGEFIEAYAAAEAFVKAHDLPVDPAGLERDRYSNVDKISKFFQNIKRLAMEHETVGTVEAARMKYGRRFGGRFMYEFTDGDLKRIQELINELRAEITKSKLFDEKHRQRMLKRLEKLQAELHKKMGSIDQIWGLMSDAGVALGKFGEDAKPLIDRYTEIVEIGWRSVLQAEQLPSGFQFPRLPDGNEKKDED